MISILLSCFNSCKRDGEENRKHEMYIYYDIYEGCENLPVGSYRISDNNECVYYKYDYSTGNRCIWTVEDLVPVNYWKYYKNGVIDIQGYRFKFVGFSKDTIIISEIFDNTIERLVKSKNQSDINCK